MPIVANALRTFVPENWGEVARFQKFYSGTYKLNDREQRALAGITSHYEKCHTLTALAEKLRPNLEIDKKELDEQGYTPAIHADEIAAVIEAAILEFYSSVDCAAKVIRAIYGPKSRGFRKSTRGLFENAQEISGEFPEKLKQVILNASWYRDFLHLRDDLTHLDTGLVSLNERGDSVRYLHSGMKKTGKPFVLENIFDWLLEMMEKVNQWLGEIFHHLNGELVDKPVYQVCGLVKGRALHRWISPVGELTFDSGMCGAWEWFERPENPTCPFVENCGAYRKKAPVGGFE